MTPSTHPLSAHHTRRKFTHIKNSYVPFYHDVSPSKSRDFQHTSQVRLYVPQKITHKFHASQLTVRSDQDHTFLNRLTLTPSP